MRFFVILVSVMLLYLPSGLADTWNPNAQTPVQLYQEADTPSAATQPAESTTQQPALVDTPSGSQNQPVLSNQTEALVKQEILQLNRNALLFEQTTNAKIEDLTQRVDALEQRLKQVAKAFVMMNQQVIALKQHLIEGSSPFEPPASHETYFTWIVSAAIALIIVLLVGLVVYFWRKSHRQSASAAVITTPETKETQDTQDEYDYMGSSEGIVAKLNLARAYLAMEDYPEAKKIIDEVRLLGNQEQRQAADHLAQEMPDTDDSKA